MPFRRRVTYSRKSNHAARAAHARGAREFKTYDTSAIRPQRPRWPWWLAVGVLVLLVVGLVAGVGALMRSCSSHPQLAQGATAEVVVEKGETLGAVAESLARAGVVPNADALRDACKAAGLEQSLKAGRYRFTGGMSVAQVVDTLKAGPNAEANLVVPEGLVLADVAKRVEAAYPGKISAADFEKAAGDASAFAKDYPFLKEAGTNSLEGFLYPKTYPLLEGDAATADGVIRMMLDQYAAETKDLDWGVPESHGLNRYQALILASIVEKEGLPDNVALVASVFYNRMDQGMALQSDATTAYVVRRDPTPDDLKVEGPYNTYLNRGLPPTPICNPGDASLRAVCHPQASDYLYFYFKKVDGKLDYRFSRTYEEHQDAIAR